MSVPRTPIRVELLFGGLCGLGLSLFLWIPFSSPALREVRCLVFVGLAAAGGALAAELSRRHSGPFLIYPAILSAQMVHGLGPAILTAGLGAILWALLGAQTDRRDRFSRLPLELSKLTLGAGVAGAVYMVAGGNAASAAWPPVLHAASFAALDLALSSVSDRWPTGAEREGRRQSLALRAVGSAAALPVAWLIVAGHASPGFRPWLAMLPATLFAFHLGRLPARRPGRLPPQSISRRSVSLYRSLTLGLARAAASTDPPLAAHQRRVEHLSRAVAERLGLPHMEVEALSAAALLHESDRLALLDGPPDSSGVATHPGLAAELVSTIRYPYAVMPIVRHLRERWDGTGRPDGLAGEAIPRGARILAVADDYDSAISGRRSRQPVSPAAAVAQLQAAAGRRFDPLAVDLLVEHLEQSEDRESVSGPGLRALQAGEQDLELLGQLRRAAGAALLAEDRLTLIAARLGMRLAHRAFVVYRMDEATNRLTVRFACGEPAGRLWMPQLPADRGIFGLALREDRTLIANPADLPAGPTAGASCWVAPLAAHDGPRELLVLYDVAERRFEPRDRQLVVRVARIVGSAIGEARADKPAPPLTLTDSVTGLPNARYLRRAVTDRLEEPRGPVERFGLVAVAGVERGREDRRLCGAARRLATACGSEETLVRFGPEQFVLLTPIHRPSELVERTHEIVRALVTSRSSACAAHATYPRDGEDLDDLLSALDARLALSGEHRLKMLAFRPARSAS